MALRNQFDDIQSTYPQPTDGVNLRTTPRDLRPTEALLMQNCEVYGTRRIRRGSQRLNTTSYGSYMGLGGHKFYYGGPNPNSKRLIAYNTTISTISDIGVESQLTTGMTPGQPTYFTTWPITEKAYISNGSNVLSYYDGTTFGTVTGTNVPIVRGAVVPIIDRLLGITADGIERSGPRLDSVWSANSDWATFRPQRPGLFTAMHPYALRGQDTLTEGVIALQERAYYHISGQDFGATVDAVTASPGEDTRMKLIDPTVGTNSPDSLLTVPGVGIFWFTTDLNVFFIPDGQLVGSYIGTNIQSTGSTPGLESCNTTALRNVWMTYFDHILMLGIPSGTNPYASTQWWLDMRVLRGDSRNRKPVWYGPMIGQTVSRAWVENQNGDNAVYGLEGNANNGLFVYQLRVPSRFTDAIGINDIPISLIYQSYFKDFGMPSREKYMQSVHFDMNTFSGTATVDLVDLNQDIITGVPIEVVS